MKYDFDKIVHRRGSGCYKWDEEAEEGIIPMWVADMDFPTAPAIIEALRRRVEHGVFGYSLVPDSYYEAVVSWFSRRHQWHIEREWIQYTTGVVPALVATQSQPTGREHTGRQHTGRERTGRRRRNCLAEPLHDGLRRLRGKGP